MLRVDTRRVDVDHGGVEREQVIEHWREIERELVIGWCGASAVSRPAAALRELLAKQRAAEGSDYEVKLTGWGRIGQVLILALCQRYGLRPFRRKGQRHSTIIVQGPETFVEKVFMPILDRGLAAVLPGVDAWLNGVVEACILDDTAEKLIR